MRRNKLLITLLSALALAGCNPQMSNQPPQDESKDLTLDLPPYSGRKQIIAVLDLDNKTDFEDPRIGRGISSMLITALVNSGRFTVVERNDEVLKKIFAEQKLGQTGAVTAQTAAQVGKMLGAKAVLIGEVSEFGIRKTSAFVGVGGKKTITTRVVVDARMVDSETAEITGGATGIGASSTTTQGVALTFEFGTAGFDETTIGMATRKAVNQIVTKIAGMVDAKQLKKGEMK
jgi:curli biogenesis system outer membrane secretion channel CsgG